MSFADTGSAGVANCLFDFKAWVEWVHRGSGVPETQSTESAGMKWENTAKSGTHIQILMKQIREGQSNHRRMKHKWRQWDETQQGEVMEWWVVSGSGVPPTDKHHYHCFPQPPSWSLLRCWSVRSGGWLESHCTDDSQSWPTASSDRIQYSKILRCRKIS